jgi:hypothetical protein
VTEPRFAGNAQATAKVLYRNPDGSVVLEVYDGSDDDVMWVVHPDGSRYEERIVGIRGVRDEWAAAAAAWDDGLFDPVSGAESVSKSESRPVPPEHAGRKRAVESEPEPVPKLEKKAEGRIPAPVSAEVEQAVRDIADAVRSRLVMGRAEVYERRPASDVDRYLAHAVAMNWVTVDGDVLRPGRVDHRPVVPVGDVDGPSWGGGLARVFRG